MSVATTGAFAAVGPHYGLAVNGTGVWLDIDGAYLIGSTAAVLITGAPANLHLGPGVAYFKGSSDVPVADVAQTNVLTPAFTNNTAAQLSDVNRDYMVYLQVGTPGTVFTLSIGPTSGVANAIIVSATPTAAELFAVRLPAGWFLRWAGTSTTIANQKAIGC
jgi:hypothetical protein